MLTFWFCDLFLSWISNELIAELFIRNKTRPDFMIMLSFFSLIAEFFSDIEIGELSRLDKISIDFECKGAKSSVVYTSSSLHIFPDVFSKGFENKVELRFGIQGLNGIISPWLRHKVASSIILRMGNNPDLVYHYH